MKNTIIRFSLAVALIATFALNTTNAQDDPILTVSPGTGDVVLNPNGLTILSFNIQSDNRFTPPADFTLLEKDTFDVPGLADNLPGAIGWVSALAAGGQGYHGTDSSRNNATALLGAIFPTGLNEAGYRGLLTNNAWAGPGGTGGAFVVNVIPEPTSLMLLGMSGLGMLLTRRRKVA